MPTETNKLEHWRRELEIENKREMNSKERDTDGKSPHHFDNAFQHFSLSLH